MRRDWRVGGKGRERGKESHIGTNGCREGGREGGREAK